MIGASFVHHGEDKRQIRVSTVVAAEPVGKRKLLNRASAGHGERDDGEAAQA